MSRYVFDDDDDDCADYYCSDSDDADDDNFVANRGRQGAPPSSDWRTRLAYVPKYRGGFGPGFTRLDSSTSSETSASVAAAAATAAPASRSRAVASTENDIKAERLAREKARSLLSNLSETALRDGLADCVSRDWLQEAEGWAEQLDRQGIGADDLPELRRALQRCYQSVNSPWTAAWFLANHRQFGHRGRARGKNQQFGMKGSLEFVCVSELLDWMRQQARGQGQGQGQTLPMWLKQLAFCLGYRGGPQFFSMLADAFALSEQPGAMAFLVIIRRLIELHLYKEAAQAATALYLQEQLAPDDLVLPLIGQDKVGVAEEFLDSNPNAQVAALRYLDEALESQQNLLMKLHDRCVPGLRPEKLSAQQLRKLLDRLTRKFGIDPADVCPARAKTLAAGQVRFLLHQRLVNRSLSRAALLEQLENLMDSLIDDADLQREIVASLTQHGKLDEALNYALQEFCWDLDDLPHRLQERHPAWCQLPGGWLDEPESDDDHEAGVGAASHAWPSSSDSPPDAAGSSLAPVLKLPLQSADVVWVDSSSEFELALQYILSASRLGIDAEWSNSGSVSSMPADAPTLSVHVFQLAVEPNSNVYLLDVPSLLKSGSESSWLQLGQVLANPTVPKLGIGIREDLRRLRSAIGAASLSMPEFDGIVELDGLAKRLATEYPNLLDQGQLKYRPSSSEERGLSELCLKVLGCRLDKSERLSDWSRRPLRASQLAYAALDALCPLLVRQALLDRAACDTKPIVESMFLPVVEKGDSRKSNGNQLANVVNLLNHQLDDADDNSFSTAPGCLKCGCTRTSTLPARAICLALGCANAGTAPAQDWELRDWLADGVDVARGTLALTSTRIWLPVDVDISDLIGRGDSDKALWEAPFNVCVNCGRVSAD